MRRVLCAAAAIATAGAGVAVVPSASAAEVVQVVRPGELGSWAVDFFPSDVNNTVMPGFVTGPGTAPLGEGAFRFDNGESGAALPDAKVELTTAALNRVAIADIEALTYDLYVEDVSDGTPFINVKLDTDGNNSIDASLTYLPTAPPLNTWTTVDPLSDTGNNWACASGAGCVDNARKTWAGILADYPNGVVTSSFGFPRAVIFNAGQTGGAGNATRGAVDNFAWTVNGDVTRNDFEPVDVSVPTEVEVSEPAVGTAAGRVPVTLSALNSFISFDALLAGRRGQPVEVDYETSDGTALAGDDYEATSGTLTFPPDGEDLTRDITIPILATPEDDAGKTFDVTLTAAVNGIITQQTATVTIGEPAPPTTVVVRPGELNGWAVDFLTDSVNPGFVTDPPARRGEGAFRFDTGESGAAAPGAKVELTSGGLNGVPLAGITALSYDVFVEETTAGQPYLNIKLDTDGNGGIDATITYDGPSTLPLGSWVTVNPVDDDIASWRCSGDGCLAAPGVNFTWAEIVAQYPDAVVTRSFGFPRAFIFNAGQTGTSSDQSTRGVVDNIGWTVDGASTVHDFEPPFLSVPADTEVSEPAIGTTAAKVPVTLSALNSFTSLDAIAAGRRGQDVTVSFETVDGSAVAGQDYVATSGDLVFPAAGTDLVRDISVPVLPTSDDDAGKAFTVTLTAAVNGVLTQASTTVTITEPTNATTVVVQPGDLAGWAVDFLPNNPTLSVAPGFVTGPATPPLGAGGFRFDTGVAGSATPGAKVELTSDGLNGVALADISALTFDVFLDETTASPPYLNIKIDTDGAGGIDKTLSYVAATNLPLGEWLTVDPVGDPAERWTCRGDGCPPGSFTFAELQASFPDAVVTTSLGFPRALIFTAGQTGTTSDQTTRGVVDNFGWTVNGASTIYDFEPPLVSASPTELTVAEPSGAPQEVDVTTVSLSGLNTFASLDAIFAGRKGQPVTVDYQTVDGTAIAGQDYTSTSGTLLWPDDADDPDIVVPVEILPDAEKEGPEDFVLELSNVVNGILVTTQVTVTITDLLPSYVPISPVRLLDTRDGTGVPSAGPVAPGGLVELQVAGEAGIPEDAKAVTLNVTVTQPLSGGNVKVYPCGSVVPISTNLNFVQGQTIPNLTITSIGEDGKVCLATTAGTHLIADAQGYFTAASDYEPIVPERLIDTRRIVDPPVPVAAKSTLRVPVTERFGIPGDAVAAVLNVTVTQPAVAGSVTVYPCDVDRPTSSNINYQAGQTIPGMALTQLSAEGDVCIYTNAQTHLVVDIGGWFPSGTDYTPLAPERLLDTRIDLGAPGPATPGEQVELTVVDVGVSQIPADAGAVVLNVTATQSAGLGGNVRVYPCGVENVPTASNLNFRPGQNSANAVISKVGDEGKVCLLASEQVELVADVTGWFPNS